MTEAQPGPSWVRVALWAVVCVVVCAWMLPVQVRSLRPGPDHTTDFFQDWAAARYFFEGRSIYADQEPATLRYFGRPIRKDSPRDTFNQFNAHPPPAVLLVLPFGRLDYPTAQLVWTSLWLLLLPAAVWLALDAAEVRPRLWTLLIWLPLLTWCMPLQGEVFQGQLNRVILLLVVLAWVLERGGRPWLAGACIGAAASIKVLPAFLFLYFLCRGRWRALAGGLLAALALNAVAASVFGVGAYEEYVGRVVPLTAERYRDDAMNVSLTAFWTRLFDPVRGGAEPMVASHGLFVALRLASQAAVILAAAWAAWKARSEAARDHAYAAAVAGALLVSPITWAPYFLLLLPAGVLLWRDLPAGSWRRVLFLACLCDLWLSDLLVFTFQGRQAHLHVARPWESLTYVSAATYAVAGFFVLGVMESRRAEARAPAPERPEPTREELEPAGTAMPRAGQT
jgi:hypothetical protein